MTERMSRRRLIGVAGAAGAALLVGGPAVLAGTRINPYARGTYSALVGQSFQMTTSSGPHTVVLSEVADLDTPGAAGDLHRFSLMFRGAKGSRSEAGIYSFRHRTI